MVLKVELGSFDRRMRPVVLTREHLAEMMTLFPTSQTFSMLKVGHYSMDSIEDLDQSSEVSLPSAVIGSYLGVLVEVYRNRTSVRSSQPSGDDRLAAETIAAFLRRRQQSWLRILAIPLGLVAFGILIFSLCYLANTLAITIPLLVVEVAVCAYLARRQLPDPIVLRPAEKPWLEQHPTMVAIVLGVPAAASGIASVIKLLSR